MQASALAQELAEVRASLAAADEAKNLFLSSMTHEIRTPMNGVIGMTGLLLDTPLTPQQRQYAEIARASGESLMTAIQDVIDYSAIDAGRLQLDAFEFNPIDVLEEVAETLAFRAYTAGLTLACVVARDVPPLVKGDPTRFRQVVFKLVDNSIRFTEQGRVTLRAAVDHATSSHLSLRVSVTDTGNGIDTRDLQTLFSPYVEAEGATTRRYGGAGLSLAISKRMAELMGGTVSVESHPGHGSTFRFTAMLETPARPQLPDNSDLAAIAGARILVVDDDTAEREGLVAVLEGWGCEVAIAEDPDTAIGAIVAASDTGDIFRVALVPDPLEDSPEPIERLATVLEASGGRLVAMRPVGYSGTSGCPHAAFINRPFRRIALARTLARAGALRPAAQAAAPDTLVTPVRSAGRGISVLVAEDDLTTQLVILETLERMGLEAHLVPDGAEAVEALRRRSYAVVLMDGQMPVMDGYEATRLIRSGAGGVINPRVPIVALGLDGMPGCRETCLAAGMNDYISKPIRPLLLSETIERWAPTAPAAVARGAAVHRG